MGANTLGGKPCAQASLTIPRRGAWSADVVLNGPEPVAGKQILAIGGLSASGTVLRAAPYAGSVRARLVGGAGGWRKTIPARGYSHPAGVKKSSLIADAAREVGEQVLTADDSIVGAHWGREKGPAERILRILTGGAWYVGLDGVTRFGDRPSGRISSPFTVQQRDAGKGRFEISTETFQDWMPGRSFMSPTVTDEQVISLVSITSDNDGTTRLVVLTDPQTDRERMLDDFRAIVRQELAELAMCGFWRYTISTGDSSAADVVPVGDRVPALTRCPYLPGLMGENVTPKPGTPCVVCFLDASPAHPRIVHIEGAPLVAEMKAQITKIGDGLRAVAAMGDLAGPFPIAATGLRVLV